MVPVTMRDLVVRFGTGPSIVDRVTLAVEAGELFLLLGPSGCGKTTLLRATAGFIAVTAGSIRFGDDDVTGLPPHRRGAGMVFQSFALWPHMTVAANVAFGLREQGVARAEAGARVEAVLEATRMKGYGPRRIDELSGGEQQRVALARALVVHPRCLLLDEPLSNLDARLRQAMREEVRRICKSFGLTTIYVTHDQKEALAIADRIAIMQQGRILQVGAPADVYRHPRSRAVAAFIGETNLIQGRVVAWDASGVRVDSPMGALVAGKDQTFAPQTGEAVWISIRPECLHVTPIDTRSVVLPNTLRGREIARVYLGEIAERRLQIGDVPLSAYELNPGGTPPATGETVAVNVHPADVVLLPVED
jgi:iron(III) transport system ATP-binding protein